MIKVYWKLSSEGIFYGIQVPHFGIQSISFLKSNKKYSKERVKSIFFTPSLVDIEETDLDVIDFPSFEITKEEFIRWLGMLGTDNVKSMEDLGWLLRLKKDYESRLVRC